MSQSEVFDEFIKIAMEKGLVSEGEAEHTEQNTKSPRWDSMDISAIEALYGVKPEQSKDMDYDHNIMEVAHPNAVVVSPSYDKLNGLVENNNEQQAILMHILYKEPESGSPNQGMYPMRPTLLYPNPKYASKDLMMSLVRVANDMDNKDKDDLRVLADKCIEQMHHGLRKQAFLPWLIGAAVGLALLYWEQHSDTKDQGLATDYSNLMDAMGDLMSDNVTWGLWGEQVDDSVRQLLGDVQRKMAAFWDAYQSIIAGVDVSGGADLIKWTQSEAGQKAQKAISDLPALVKDVQVGLDNVKKEFSNIDFKSRHTGDKGVLTSLIDKIPGLHGGQGSLTTDKFDAVINSIQPFLDSIKRFEDTDLKTIQRAFGQIHENLTNATASKPEAQVPAAPAEKTVADLDNEGEGIAGALKNLGLTGF